MKVFEKIPEQNPLHYNRHLALCKSIRACADHKLHYRWLALWLAAAASFTQFFWKWWLVVCLKSYNGWKWQRPSSRLIKCVMQSIIPGVAFGNNFPNQLPESAAKPSTYKWLAMKTENWKSTNSKLRSVWSILEIEYCTHTLHLTIVIPFDIRWIKDYTAQESLRISGFWHCFWLAERPTMTSCHWQQQPKYK